MLIGMTLMEPTTTRPDPAGSAADGWESIRERAKGMTKWTDQAVGLAAEEAGRKRPSRIARWRGRRLAAKAEAFAVARAVAAAGRVAGTGHPAAGLAAPAAGRLRLVPPVAALGTAFVLQVVAMTDVVGSRLAEVAAQSAVPEVAARPHLGYLAAMLLGIAVASCFEGAAAYLMDLYDRHLMARDSVWVLRLAMVGYVATSAGVIHWWLTTRDLPAIISWVLAGMSASALFLWSRGSRWRHRAAMRSAGHLDPAMPRLPMAAKVFHPVRWIVTLYLVSWDPAETPAEARARYERWSADRQAAKETRTTTKAASASEAAPAAIDPDDDQDGAEGPNPADRPPADQTPGHGPVAITDAAMLRAKYGSVPPGRNELYRLHGGNKERWTNALKAFHDQADRQPATG